jgi:hypothetical protein
MIDESTRVVLRVWSYAELRALRGAAQELGHAIDEAISAARVVRDEGPTCRSIRLDEAIRRLHEVEGKTP